MCGEIVDGKAEEEGEFHERDRAMVLEDGVKRV